jgi:HEPN domain-containing protein
MKQMKDRIEYWIELSDYDLETAEAMLVTKRFLYVGFMCHQSIEKILKAYYVKIKNDTPPFTHNLSYLVKQIDENSWLSDEYNDLIDILDPLNIESRYPSYKEEILKSLTLEKCNVLIKETSGLQTWIKMKL